MMQHLLYLAIKLAHAKQNFADSLLGQELYSYITVVTAMPRAECM